MKIGLNQEILNLIMPTCKKNNISPANLVKDIIKQHYSMTGKKEDDTTK